MTNEHLAAFIQDGDSEDLKPILWERVKPTLYKKADYEFNRRKWLFDKCGVELWDVRMACYEVYLKALHGYKRDRNEMFVTYLQYPFQTAINTLLGTLNGTPNNKPLDNCTSLNKPIIGTDGEELTLAEILEDTESETADEQLTRREMKRIVRAAVGRLDEPYCEIVREYYFKRMSNEQIGDIHHVSAKHVRLILNKAIRKLRKDKDLRLLHCYNGLSEIGGIFAGEYFCGFEDSKEYAAAVQETRSNTLSYGKRTAVFYEAKLKYQKRVRQERERKKT